MSSPTLRAVKDIARVLILIALDVVLPRRITRRWR